MHQYSLQRKGEMDARVYVVHVLTPRAAGYKLIQTEFTRRESFSSCFGSSSVLTVPCF